MFNTYNHMVRNDVPRNISIKEQRAPTDESVRLLKEMETEAHSKLIDTIDLESNVLNGKILLFNDHLNHSIKVIALIEINNKKHEFECKIPGYVVRIDNSKENIYRQIYELIGAKITRMLMNDIQQL